MAKIKVDGFTDEWECGTDPGALALDKGIKERMGDVSALESAAGKSAKDAREVAFMTALGVKTEEKAAPKEKKGETVEAREAAVLEALAVRVKKLQETVGAKGVSRFELDAIEREVRALKGTVALRDSEALPELSQKTISLVERFQAEEISAMTLLDELRKTGFLK